MRDCVSNRIHTPTQDRMCFKASSLFNTFFFSRDLYDTPGRGKLQRRASIQSAAVQEAHAATFSIELQQPVHRCELWAHVFYIITDTESIDILIKGREYWVGSSTAHQLSLPREVDSHNPRQGAPSSIKSLWRGSFWSPANGKGVTLKARRSVKADKCWGLEWRRVSVHGVSFCGIRNFFAQTLSSIKRRWVLCDNYGGNLYF